MIALGIIELHDSRSSGEWFGDGRLAWGVLRRAGEEALPATVRYQYAGKCYQRISTMYLSLDVDRDGMLNKESPCYQAGGLLRGSLRPRLYQNGRCGRESTIQGLAHGSAQGTVQAGFTGIRVGFSAVVAA